MLLAQPFNAGLQVGLGYRYQEALLFQVDYSMGLRTTTAEATNSGGLEPYYTYNRAFRASLSYLFNLTAK